MPHGDFSIDRRLLCLLGCPERLSFFAMTHEVRSVQSSCTLYFLSWWRFMENILSFCTDILSGAICGNDAEIMRLCKAQRILLQ